MAKVISEVLYSRNFSSRTKYPVSFVMKVKETAAKHGKMEIKEESVYGSTAGKKITSSFEIERNLDNITSVVFSFIITGEDENVNVFVRGIVRTVLEEKDEIFNEFYSKEILKNTMTRSKNIINRTAKSIEEEIREI